jgi:hypothetical protein
MCGIEGARLAKYLKIIVMGFETGRNGEPEDAFLRQGC